MNRLQHETSPYLRQHADNPVDWYPWGEEAFTRARTDDKAILLSVGYSSCHWCHVMAHESFENEQVASVMNRLFVNVKVDREERPDVDAVYMEAVQALTGHGGWPMTVFLDHDGRPFYGGTYFPAEDRQGMPGLVRVLEAVHDAWVDRRDEVLDQAEQIRDSIARTTRLGAGGGFGATDRPAHELLARAVTTIGQQFDDAHGGFGSAPKFPQAMTLTFLADMAVRDPAPVTGEPEIVRMITRSLDAMAAGGMYDQIGGGFHRYSVDDRWLVPHFEKMLYDQALLVRAYLRGWLLTHDERYHAVVEETIGYVLRDLRVGEGFASAEDADSEGVEGKFYLWSPDEIEAVCGADAPAVVEYFGVTPNGNFQDPHTGYRGSILFVDERHRDRPEAVARSIPLLLEARARRVRPALDDKVLLGWNALFLRSLAEAAGALERDDWLDVARGNARFLLRELRRSDGRLLRSWQDGRANLRAYAEDYAALLEALLTMAEVDDIGWLVDARVVADDLVRLFGDDERGGFFTTGVDAEQLIVRPKDMQDNATPAASSMAASGLLRLAALTGDNGPAELGSRWALALAAVAADHAPAFAYLLGAFERATSPSLEIAVIGDPGDDATLALRREVQGRLLPAAVSVASAGDGRSAELTPLLRERELLDGRPTAFVCERFSCRLPVTDAADLRAQLDDALAVRRR